MAKETIVQRASNRIKADNERGARAGLIEELFYDFNRSRAQIYKMNFVRGIFFGLGSVLGGTVLIALLAWILSFFIHIPDGVGNSIQQVEHSIQSNKKTP
jgi:hypothetical protein